MKLPNYIVKAAKCDVNYSSVFTQQVSELAQRLGKELGFSIKVDSTMNYRAGQNLSFRYSDKEPYLPADEGAVEIRIYISSKADLFAFYCLDHKRRFIKNNDPSHPVPANNFPIPILKNIEKATNFLIECGYTEVKSDIFNEIIPGTSTELDDLPSTVFQSLFAEIV